MLVEVKIMVDCVVMGTLQIFKFPGTPAEEPAYDFSVLSIEQMLEFEKLVNVSRIPNTTE